MVAELLEPRGRVQSRLVEPSKADEAIVREGRGAHGVGNGAEGLCAEGEVGTIEADDVLVDGADDLEVVRQESRARFGSGTYGFCARAVRVGGLEGDGEVDVLVLGDWTGFVDAWVEIDIGGAGIDQKDEILAGANGKVGEPETLLR